MLSTRVALLTVLVFLCINSIAIAQAPCEGQCDGQVPWVPGSFTLGLSGDCQVVLNYEVRVCGATHEMRMIGAIITGPCVGFTDPISDAIGILVRSNQMGFPTGAGSALEVSHNWVIHRPACWRRLSADQYVPCSNDCCTTTLTVRNKANCDTWKIVSANSIIPTRQCSIETSYMAGVEQQQCGSSCSEVFFLK
jgi:hypothetical protein